MDLIQSIVERARADRQRIVLPEGTEERTLKAADRLIADGVADIILIGSPTEIDRLAGPGRQPDEPAGKATRKAGAAVHERSCQVASRTGQ